MSLEINIIDGAFVLAIAGAAPKRPIGLAWKSVRGPRAGQMYTRVSWEPGNLGYPGSSFSRKTGSGAAGITNPRHCGRVSITALSLKKGHKPMETEKVL